MSESPVAQGFCGSCGAPRSGSEAVCPYCGAGPRGTMSHRDASACSACDAAVPGVCGVCQSCGMPVWQRNFDGHSFRCPICPEPHPWRGWRLCIDRGDFWVLTCTGCTGTWIDHSTWEALVDRIAEQPAEPLDVRAIPRKALPPDWATREIIYRNCPRCATPMQRRNIGLISGIIVDDCAVHGRFLNPGDLHPTIGFLRAGGLQAGPRLLEG